MIDDTHLPCHRGVCVDSPFLWLRAERDHHPEPHRAAHARLGREPAGASGLWHGPRLALRSRWTRLTLSGGRRVPGRRDLRECLAGRAWLRPGDDCPTIVKYQDLFLKLQEGLGSELRFVIWRLGLESPCSPGCPGGGISGVENRGHLWGYRGSNIIRALQGEPESS